MSLIVQREPGKRFEEMEHSQHNAQYHLFHDFCDWLETKWDNAIDLPGQWKCTVNTSKNMDNLAITTCEPHYRHFRIRINPKAILKEIQVRGSHLTEEVAMHELIHVLLWKVTSLAHALLADPARELISNAEEDLVETMIEHVPSFRIDREN